MLEAVKKIRNNKTILNFDLKSFLKREANIPFEDMIDMGDYIWEEKLWDTEEYQDYQLKIRNEKINKITGKK